MRRGQPGPGRIGHDRVVDPVREHRSATHAADGADELQTRVAKKALGVLGHGGRVADVAACRCRQGERRKVPGPALVVAIGMPPAQDGLMCPVVVLRDVAVERLRRWLQVGQRLPGVGAAALAQGHAREGNGVRRQHESRPETGVRFGTGVVDVFVAHDGVAGLDDLEFDRGQHLVEAVQDVLPILDLHELVPVGAEDFCFARKGGAVSFATGLALGNTPLAAGFQTGQRWVEAQVQHFADAELVQDLGLDLPLVDLDLRLDPDPGSQNAFDLHGVPHRRVDRTF